MVARSRRRSVGSTFGIGHRARRGSAWRLRHLPARHTRLTWHFVPTAVGLFADRYLGEPPVDPHPVALFGSAMSAIERGTYEDDRNAGILHAGIGIGIGALAGWGLRSSALATYLAVAGKALREAANAVAEPLAAGDLDTARTLLPSLVGRDPTGLDAGEIARATVESVAENTTDAIVAPALWSALGGAPAALAYRATNTLDAMVGHHSPIYEHFGWASARADDVANYVPARITAALVALVRPRRAVTIWATVRRDAAGHPSPNAGVAESAFAAVLGVTLGGTNRYGDRVESRATMGDGRAVEPGDIAVAVRLASDVQAALALVLLVTGAVDVLADVLSPATRGVARRAARRVRRRRSITTISTLTSPNAT